MEYSASIVYSLPSVHIMSTRYTGEQSTDLALDTIKVLSKTNDLAAKVNSPDGELMVDWHLSLDEC